jgi:hypothetical protein
MCVKKNYKYSEEYLTELCSKFNSRKDLNISHPGIVGCIRKRGLTHLFNHMEFLGNCVYDYNEVKKIALKYKTKVEFKKSHSKLYGWVMRKYKERKEIFSHMEVLRTNVTQEEIDTALIKCKTIEELKNNYKNVYYYISRREGYQEITKHLIRRPKKEKKNIEKPIYNCVYCGEQTKLKICHSCKNIIKIPLTITEINKDNIKDYTIGQINRWMIQYISRDKWKDKIIELLNFLNPNIEYHIENYNMFGSSRVLYKCKIHPVVNGETNLSYIFNKKSGCPTCLKGEKHNGYWTTETIKSELKDVITKYYNETNIIPLLSVVSNELISGIASIMYRLIDNPSQFYLDFLKENGFPPPDDALFKDGVLFRGHYEYVGYCFVKSWGINVIPVKKMDKYYSDGYFTDIDTYWEHWGNLNKNNSKKKKLYKKNKLNLFETYDNECAKFGKGYEYLYNIMRDFFISKGYKIPEYNKNELYSLLKKEVVTFETTLNWIVGLLKNEPSLSENITVKKLLKYDFGGRIVFFINKRFNGMLKFKEYVNENYGFNFPIQKNVDNYYYLSKDNLFKELTPIVKKYGRLPSRIELESEGRRDIDRFIKRQFGGFKDMRRNEIQIGKYFHIINDMLNGKAPWDLKIDWITDTEDTVKKIIQYWKSNNINLPHYFIDLEDEKIYGKLGKQLYNIITHREQNKFNITGWTDFKRKFDNYEGPDIGDKPVKIINIEINSVIGNWTVLKELDYKYFNSEKNSRIRNFLCKCVCGTEKEVSLSKLRRKNGHCGCLTKEKIDFEQKYGDLTILEEIKVKTGKNRLVIVKCDCGNEKRMQYTYIRNNMVTNCGCKKPIYKEINNT